MTETQASYAFLPFLRVGLATRITREDETPREESLPSDSKPRSSVDVDVTMSVYKSGKKVDDKVVSLTELPLRGPGDVVGFDPRVVVRTWPRGEVYDAEPNYFPLCEFSEPDFPWRYTPARPPGSAPDRLRPWICLIVLREDEFEEFIPASPDRPLAFVRVKPGAALPDLEQAWAWAHVQVSGVFSITSKEALEFLEKEPERFVSRLVSPRRLDVGTAYRACVVPTFECGRLAGLGEEVPDTVDGLRPSWPGPGKRTEPIELPVYYFWRFQVGPGGDFEQLASRLETRTLPPTLSVRYMDASDPGILAFKPIDGTERQIPLEGALRVPATAVPDWDGDRSRFVQTLMQLLNLPATLSSDGIGAEDVVLTPPLYGQWPAERRATGGGPAWFDEINTDPANRVPAGLGTQVVQKDQQPLMAAAWTQIEGLPRVNDTLKAAQFAVTISEQIHEKRVETRDPASLLRLTAPLHARIRVGSSTLLTSLRRSAIQTSLMEPVSTKITRPLGPMGRRIYGARRGTSPPLPPSDSHTPAPGRVRRGTGPTRSAIAVPGGTNSRKLVAVATGRGRSETRNGYGASAIVTRLNQGELTPAPPSIPHIMATPARLGASLLPRWATPIARKISRILGVGLWIGGVVLLFVASASLFFHWPDWLSLTLGGVGLILLRVAAAARDTAGKIDNSSSLMKDQVTPEQIWSAPGRPNFMPVETMPFDSKQAVSLASEPVATQERDGLSIVEESFSVPRHPSTPVPSQAVRGAAGKDNASGLAFRSAAADVFGGVAARPPGARPVAGVDLAAVQKILLAETRPRTAIPVAVLSRLRLPSGWTVPKTLQEIIVGPEFAQAMYKPLSELSQDWMLPGVDQIPNDTVTLLETNQRFVEAYLAGLNHEMARTLLWNEAPTDLRATFFRQFWDPTGYAGDASNDDLHKDIQPMRDWSGSLGGHGGAGSLRPDHLVFLIRGELFRRYPNTVVYAVKAERQGNRLVLGTEELLPVFSGTLPPDISFFGFKLTAEEALRAEGWFFVLQEPISEPRFGFDIPNGEDVPTSWSDLTWAHLVAKKQDLSILGYVDVTANRPDTSSIRPASPGDPLAIWGQSAAHMAFITLQQPVRIVVHASEMLKGFVSGTANQSGSVAT